MDEIESKRMVRAYSAHLDRWRAGKEAFMSPTEWLTDWLVKKAQRIMQDRACAALGAIEA